MTNLIYILRLENGKYYVGKTNNLGARLEEHRRGEGAEWTRIYPMIELIDKIYIFPRDSPYLEDDITDDYIRRYGRHNVRGGSRCDVELPHKPTEWWNIRRERHARNTCLRCGHHGHYVIDCIA